jgi:hypothetical protein
VIFLSMFSVRGSHCDYVPPASYVTAGRHIYDLIRPRTNCHLGNGVSILSKVKKKEVTYFLILWSNCKLKFKTFSQFKDADINTHMELKQC